MYYRPNSWAYSRMENFMRKIQKIATYLLVGTLVFAGRQAMALTTPDEAAGSKPQETSQEAAGRTLKNTTTEKTEETGSGLQATVEPVAGIDTTLDKLYENTEDANKILKQSLSKVSDKKQSKLAFAQVTNYVNIRSKGSENGEILGKLYDDAAATVISKKKGWYKIKSGSVTGYIKAEFLITGDAADKLSKTVGRRVAEVSTTTLKVREKPSTDATVITLAAEGDDFKVIKELSGWVKVYIGGHKTAFLSKDFIKLETVYEEAVSIEEEQENLAEEAAANAQAADNSVTQNSSSQSSSSHSSYSNDSNSSNSSASSDSSSAGTVNTDSQSASDSSDSSLGNRIASYALQFEGNPYVWGGTSLTNGTDCSGFTQSVYSHFGISIPRTSRTQATGGTGVSLSNLNPGDLIFYARSGSINHVALYIGGGRVISASSPSTGIRITSYNYRTPVKAVSYIN